MANRFRKGDTVEISSGKDAGKRGKIVRVLPAELRIVVEGVNVVKRHRKATKDAQAGIVEMPAPIPWAKARLVSPSGKASRVGFVFVNGKKRRKAKSSGDILE